MVRFGISVPCRNAAYPLLEYQDSSFWMDKDLLTSQHCSDKALIKPGAKNEQKKIFIRIPDHPYRNFTDNNFENGTLLSRQRTRRTARLLPPIYKFRRQTLIE